MKKIMFNDFYGLTAAVLKGKKTMTRRIIQAPKRIIEGKEVCGFAIHKTHEGVPYEVWLTGPDQESLCQLLPTYKVGEVVAVAQAYKDIIGDHVWLQSTETGVSIHVGVLKKTGGFGNKMFVAAEFMPHHIRITDIKVERLQDISDEDCLKEGVYYYNCGIDFGYTFNMARQKFGTALKAFAALIDRISGKGTWERNPWVFAYSFELID